MEQLEPRVLLSAGDLDLTFGTGGLVTTDFLGSSNETGSDGPAMVVQDDGKFLVATSTRDAGGQDFGLARLNADGTPDLNFGFDGFAEFDVDEAWDTAVDVALQSTGHIIVSGYTRNGSVVARYDESGVLDPNFGSGGVATFALDVQWSGYIAINASDDIVLACTARILNITDYWDIAVLQIDGSTGSLDTTFGTDGMTFFSVPTSNQWQRESARDIAIDGTGRIIVAGTTTVGQSSLVVRFNSVGELDSTFGTEGYALIQSGSYTNLGSGRPGSVSVLPDNGILVSGNSYTVLGYSSELILAKFDSAGILDPSFDGDGIALFGGSFRTVASTDHVVDAWGNITVVMNGSTHSDYEVVQFDSNGAVNTSFGMGGAAMFDYGTDDRGGSIELLTNGSMIVAGIITGPSSGFVHDVGVIRINSSGQQDSNFGDAGWALIDFPGSASNVAQDVVALQSDGKLVVGGSTASDSDFALARYNIDGSLDTTFGIGGRVITDLGSSYRESIYALALMPDGKIIAVGRTVTLNGDTDFAIARYDTNGQLDESFGTNGLVIMDIAGQQWDYATSVAVAADGTFVVGGIAIRPGTSTFFDLVAVMFDANGELDTRFGGDGIVFNEQLYSVANDKARVEFASDGSVITSGRYYLRSGRELNVGIVSKFTPSGALDLQFGSSGSTLIDLPGTDEWIRGMTLDDQDRIILTGSFKTTIGSSNDDFLLIRLTANGAFDTNFGVDGIVHTDFTRRDSGMDVLVQPDGKIVVVGGISMNNQDFAFLRYNSDGTLDDTFGTGGLATVNFSEDPSRGGSYDLPQSIVMQPDGKLVAVGTTSNQSSATTGADFAIARIESGLIFQPVVQSIDIGRDLHSAMIQFDDVDLDLASATNVANYQIIAGGDDLNGDGDFFNDGDETWLTITDATYDASTDQVTLSTQEVIFNDLFRVIVDGDDASSDSTSGVVSTQGQHIEGGDYTADFDFVRIHLVTALLDTVEGMGLSTNVNNSLVGRLEATVTLLGVQIGTNTGVLALLDAFVIGVNHWFNRNQITIEQRDILLADVQLIIDGILAT